MTGPAAGTPEAAGEMSLLAFNVGKADCLLLRSGETAYLIDTGTEDSWPALKKALLAEGVIKLDGVILTHTHKDHVGGLEYLLDSEIEVGQIYASGYFKKKEKKHPAVIAAKAKNRTVTFLYGGDTLPLDGGRWKCWGLLRKRKRRTITPWCCWPRAAAERCCWPEIWSFRRRNPC